jgi:hypothetical protein
MTSTSAPGLLELHPHGRCPKRAIAAKAASGGEECTVLISARSVCVCRLLRHVRMDIQKLHAVALRAVRMRSAYVAVRRSDLQSFRLLQARSFALLFRGAGTTASYSATATGQKHQSAELPD